MSVIFKKKFFFIISLSCLLSGCASSLKCKPTARLNKSIDLSSKEGEAFESKIFCSNDWPEEKWWEAFDDSQLSSFIEIGLEKSPTLQSVEAQVNQANQEAYIVRSKLFPKLGAMFNVFWSSFSKEGLDKLFPTQASDLHLFNLALDFKYEFDFWAKNRNLLAAAIGEKKVQEALAQETKLILSTSIAKQYFELQANTARLQIMMQILSNKARQLELLRLRKESRIENSINLNKLAGEVSSYQEVLAAVKQEVDLEKSMLLTLMGLNPSEPLDLQAFWQQEKKRVSLPKEIGLGLISRRPDLAAELWRVEKASKLIGVAIAEFFPNVDLQALGGLQSLNFHSLFKGDAITGTLLPSIRLPIFEGGRLRGNLKAKTYAYESAVYDYNDRLLKAANEVVSSITRISSVEERLGYQTESLLLAKKNYDLVYTRYRHGIDSMLTVLRSDEKYLHEKLIQIELEKTRHQSIVSLIKSLGGGYHDNRE